MAKSLQYLANQITIFHNQNMSFQIKKFVRHNDWPLSHEIRVDLWRVLCNYKDFESNKLLYQRQLSELMKTGRKWRGIQSRTAA